jgi:DNA-binding XRE family transcriptional regulator
LFANSSTNPNISGIQQPLLSLKPMKTKLNFSVLLIKSRQSKQLTQREVATAVGVSQSAYNYWESGKHYPNVQKLVHLTRVLNIPIEEMIST